MKIVTKGDEMKDVPREHYLDPAYKKLMRTKSGEKLIAVLRTLASGMKTRLKIKAETGFSTSEVGKLIIRAKKSKYVEEYRLEKVIRRPGKPRTGERVKETGRPPSYYALTTDGWWLIRFDPEVKDRWREVEGIYEKVMEFSGFESYANLRYAIQEHPQLNEYQRPYYFMDGELQQTVLNPFIYVGTYEAEEVTQLYDELIRVLRETVRTEHILRYYLTLEESASEIEAILNRHRLLITKMQSLPEVQEYLKK